MFSPKDWQKKEKTNGGIKKMCGFDRLSNDVTVFTHMQIQCNKHFRYIEKNGFRDPRPEKWILGLELV